jgi:hypothetical protein
VNARWILAQKVPIPSFYEGVTIAEEGCQNGEYEIFTLSS